MDCTKAEIGLENGILADNTAIEEDSIVALAMLKALMSGGRVEPPANRWDPNTRIKNLRKIENKNIKLLQQCHL